jgi:hypothetical protein
VRREGKSSDSSVLERVPDGLADLLFLHVDRRTDEDVSCSG